MDLHLTRAVASDAERAAIDRALGGVPLATGGAARAQRHHLLPALHAVQDRVGWISPGAVNYISVRLEVAPADIYGVATFYALFSTKERPARVIHLCDDIACMCAGSDRLCAELESRYGTSGQSAGETTWLRSPCLGLCDRAPAALVTIAGEWPALRQLAPASSDDLSAAVAATSTNGAATVQPHIGGEPLRLLARAGKVDPESLDAYCAHGGYRALTRALELGPDGVTGEVIASKLLGRGGAAFPTGKKMEAVAHARARPHYLICNADESEPGTFKDRILMEYDPFAVVEAMTIAAYAIGCERGFIYIRGEYPLAVKRLTRAIAQARERKLLGDDVMGGGFRFDIEIRRGAGAYICGEETALFNSIEGKRGEPRSKPPFPVQAGLFGKPTQVNNVETLCNLPLIVLDSGDAYARTGTAESTGTRLFCLSGAVAQPGLYEVPHGTKLDALIAMAGGVRAGSDLAAILLGGAAGAMIPPGMLSLRLTFEDARAAGVTLGSGVVMLFDTNVDLVAILRRIAAFFRDESCGQCVPCRVGTVRQEEVLARLAARPSDATAREHDVVLLDEIGRAMRDASICGLGQTAASVIASAQTRLNLFNGGRSR